MDRLAVTAAFFFLLFFSSTTSIALDVIDQTHNNVIMERDLSRTFPDPETKSPTTILLPNSDKSGSESATVVDWEPLEKIPDSDDTAASVVSSSEPETESVPLTIISFRPINRRFRSPGNTMIPFPRRHRCRHHHQMVKPFGPAGLRGREVSYGDDMFMSGFKGPDPMFRGGVRKFPARWVQNERMRLADLREDENKEEDKNHEEEEHHHHRHHHHHHDKNWFTGKVRKFLNQF